MAKGEIKYCNIETGYDATRNQYYLSGIVMFKYNPKYVYKTEESLRVYYTTTPGDSSQPHKDIVPPDYDGTMTADMLKADSWQKPYTPSSRNAVETASGAAMFYAAKLMGLSPDMHVVHFTIYGLAPNVKYYTRAWLRLFKKQTSQTTVKPWIRDPMADQERYEFMIDGDDSKPMLCLPVYKKVTGTTDTCGIEWVDFTDCVKLPSYDVNSEDINEDWDDADYVTHRIVTRKRISGKFEMIFPSIERYRQFLFLLDQSKEYNGEGIAYVELKVHVNNVLDIREGIDPTSSPCITYIGRFFVKIDNNAWVQPIFGHYDKYSPLSVTIQEA